MLMHWKNMFDRFYCIKTEKICYILRYFLHYFVLPFHRCLANVISSDHVRSRAGQYTSRKGSKSVTLVRSYWKLRSAWIALLIHGVSPVNARLLITCGTAFYAIIFLMLTEHAGYKVQQMTIWNIFSFFPHKIGFVISCKLPHMDKICMKCKGLYSGKNV